MRSLLILVPALLMAQEPSKNPAAAADRAAESKSAAPKPAGTQSPAAAPALTTDDEKTIYALGFSMYRSLAQFDLSPTEFEIVKRALGDAAAGKPALNLTEWEAKIQPLVHA